MKRGRKPKNLIAENIRRSGRSRKESFKIKLFNATKGKMATTELIKDFSDIESAQDTNANDIEIKNNCNDTVLAPDSPAKEMTSVTTPKRKRGRPRKYPLILKENPRDLAEALTNHGDLNSPIEPIVQDVSTAASFHENLSELEQSRKLLKQKDGLSHLKVKPKKIYTYEPILPPCKVCGAKASGYHFGAITCEACKVFFRRSLTRQTSYQCTNDGNCKILSNRRISCSFCRLKKCGELGMSRNGIQRGRYTVERKTECIRKVKELEILQQERAAEESFMEYEGFDSNSSEPVPVPFFKPKPEIDSETEKLISAVVKADMGSLLVSDSQMTQLLEMQASHVEYLKLKESVFGPMESLSCEEYAEVYKNTGIDLDNRRQKFATCVFSFVHEVTKFVEFAKALPNFLALSMSDQITLLRESMLDWVLLSGFESFDSDELVFTCGSCRSTWTQRDFADMKDKRFFFQSFVATAALKKVRLQKDELAILKALVLFSPDGSEGQLKDKSFIENYQHRLTESLLVTLRKNRPHLSDRHLAVLFGRIVHSLTEVRDANICYKDLMENSLQHFPDIEFPELLVEILGDEMKVKIDTVRAACISQNLLDSPSSLSTSSCESSLSNSEMSLEDGPLWSSSAPVIVQPTYSEQLTSSILPTDSYMIDNNFVDHVVENSVDYSIVSSLVDAADGGIDRVLLLAQL